MTSLKLIQTDKSPAPKGHYSQAVVANGFVFVSGILGIKADDKEVVLREFEQQVQICLDNLKNIVEASGSELGNVVKVNVYIDDIGKWDKVNNAYEKTFASHKPARAIIPTRSLHHGLEIEIDAVALVKE